MDLGIERETASLSWDGTKREIGKRRMLIGRSRDCDIQLSDSNVSRRHAEVRQEGASYWIVDLDSTNGIEVNGQRQRARSAARGRRPREARCHGDPLPQGVGQCPVQVTPPEAGNDCWTGH